MRPLPCALSFRPLLWRMLCSVDAHLDPALDPLLLRQLFTKSGQTYLQLGSSVVPYTKSFRLYLTTTVGNPQFPLEFTSKVGGCVCLCVGLNACRFT